MDLATVTSALVSPGNPDEGDLLLSMTDDLVPTDGIEAERQAIEAGLRTWEGEWFLDLTQGVPYLRIVGVKGVSTIAIQGVLGAEILRRGTVVAITKLSVDIAADRTGTAYFEATLADGTTINGTAPVGPG